MFSKSMARIYLGYMLAAVFACVCLLGSMVILAVIFLSLGNCAGCASPVEEGDSTNLVAVLGLLAVPLCIIGGLTDFAPKMNQKTHHRVTTKRLKGR